MTTITPAPPGYAVGFVDAPARRFAPPGAENLFIVGFFDRGTVAQGAGIAGITDEFGPVVSYSSSHYSLAAAVAESRAATTWTAARVVGPSAVNASVTLSTLTITAKSAGAWANGATGGLKAQVTAVSATRRITITEDDVTVAVSPLTADIADLVAWSDDNDYVTVAGASLPVAGSATSLASGDDDRANVTVAEWTAALALLEKRYGPGILFAPDATDPDIHAVIDDHCQAFNRKARHTVAAGITKGDALTHIATRQTDSPTTVREGGTFASWVLCTPVSGDPERRVSYAAIDAGITSRLIRTQGVAEPTFGPENASSQIATSLYAEWSDADTAELYAAGVNVATDDGASIACWGYKTGDPEPLQADLHHQTVRMGFRFDAEAILRKKIGAKINPGTLASLSGELAALCAEYQKAQAFYGTPDSPGYLVDVDSVNTPESMAARELHVVVSVKHTPTADWVDLSISVSAITQTA